MKPLLTPISQSGSPVSEKDLEMLSRKPNKVRKLINKLKATPKRKSLKKVITLLKAGNSNSGNYGHSGREGQVGGSSSNPGTAGSIAIPRGRVWVDDPPRGLPKDTLEYWTKNGALDPERKKLHDTIVSKFTKDVKPVPHDQAPVAILMMGGMSSGKSSLIQHINKKEFVDVNPDAVKDHLPEYGQAIGIGNDNSPSYRHAGTMAHEESSFISKRVYADAVAANKNLIFDSSGQDADKYEKMIKHLREKGYKITVLMMDLDLPEAHRRMIHRAEENGRMVPKDLMEKSLQLEIEKAYARVPRNYERIAALADHAKMYSSRGPKPVLIQEKNYGKETVHDHANWATFRANNSRVK